MRERKIQQYKDKPRKDTWEAKMDEMRAKARQAAAEAREAFDQGVQRVKETFD